MKFRFSLKNNYDLLIPVVIGIMQAFLNFYISTEGFLKSLPAVAVISALSILMAMHFRRRGTPKSVYTVLFTLLVFYVGFSYLLDAVYPVAEQHRAAFSLRPLLLALAVGAVVYLLWQKVSGVLDWKYMPYILTGLEAMIFALLLVFGRDTNGFGTSTSLVIAGMSFQLTEVTKIVSLMFYACVLADTGTSTRHKLVFSTAFLIINAMGSLMVAELGTFVILLLLHLILVQMYVPSCELKRKYLIFMLMGLVTVITVGYLLYEYYGAAAELKGIHKYLFKIGRKIHERISVVLNIDVDMNDEGYQVAQNIKSLYVSRLIGPNFAHFTALSIPESDTSFVALVAQYGWLAGFGFLALFCFFLQIGHKMAKRNLLSHFRNSIVIEGTAVLLFMQTMFNVLGETRLMPICGVPIPFLSHGGFSMLVNIVLLSIFMRVSENDLRGLDPNETERISFRKMLEKITSFLHGTTNV